MKTLIIAEAGVNHNGSMELAKKLIDLAKDAGVDIVKFQTFVSERVISKRAPKAEYQIQTTGSGESQLEMVKKLEFGEQEHIDLIKYCEKKNIEFLSTPFDSESVHLLKRLGLKRMKIPSGEITNAPYLLDIARYKIPVILSTGNSTLGDIEEALGALAFGYLDRKEKPSLQAFQNCYTEAAAHEILRKNVVLLHCTSEYPSPYEDTNLKAMDTLRSAFGLPVGLSDHTPGIAIPLAAVAMGAVVIEKHFTTDKELKGPDHKASLSPDELIQMVRGIRQIELAIGNGVKTPKTSEIKNRNIARKSLIADKAIKKGEIFTETNLTVKRPGSGISPYRYWEYLGKTADKDYFEDDII